MDLDSLNSAAQEAIEELWNEHRIPFKPHAGKVTSEGSYYTVHFYDSRLNAVIVPRNDRQPFKELVRAAVLDRMDRMYDPAMQGRGFGAK